MIIVEKKGIDLSYHNGNIDFHKVKKSGIDFLILRSSYRNSVDKKFHEYVAQAKEAKIPIYGVYHFSYALNGEEVLKEAELAAEQVKKAGLGKDTYIFFDFEYDTVKKAKVKGVDLTKDDCNEHTKLFCERILLLGYKTGVYTNLDYYKNWYYKGVIDKYSLWLADYVGGPDFPCLLQQFTSEGSVPGINGDVDIDYLYEEKTNSKGEIKMKDTAKRSRNEVVSLAHSWIGKNEKDGTHKSIIDIYNGYGKLPRGVKMTYTASWCACTWSSLAIALGYTDIMPIEVSCGELIKKAIDMGIWVEDDSYVPKPADAILYDWDDKGVGDNTGWPDHIGVVEEVKNGKIKVIEGNKNDAVGERTIPVNGKFIRGFITPKYDEEEQTEKKDNTPQKELAPMYKVVNCNSLKCRKNPSVDSLPIVCYLSRGDVVPGTGNTKEVSGKPWIEILSKKGVGWCSGTYLEKV